MFRRFTPYTERPKVRGGTLLLISTMFLAGSKATAATPAEIRVANGDSVVYIKFEGTDASGVPKRAEATGVVISADGFVLTAKHSVEDAQGRPVFHGDIYEIRGANGSPHEPLRLMDEVERGGADVLLLRFMGSRTVYKPVRVCSGVPAEVGDRLVTLGFPKGQDLSIIDGLLSRKAGTLWQTSVPFTYGYSGGPVFAEENGQLVGLVQGGIEQMQSINFLTPIYRATSLLQDAGVMSSSVPCALGGGQPPIKEIEEKKSDLLKRLNETLVKGIED